VRIMAGLAPNPLTRSAVEGRVGTEASGATRPDRY
jgi:hypothetical protein